MKFSIDYNEYLGRKQVVYRKAEYSFDTIPYIPEIDFDIAINTIALTVVDGKVIQLNGFCGLSKTIETPYDVPKAEKGLLKVLYPEVYITKAGSPKLNDKNWTVFINPKTRWICIGNPQCQERAVEFIDNCIGVIDGNQELVALWLHPCFI